MRPSLTAGGAEWLGRLIESQRPAATLLIDSLEIHDHTAVLNSIIETVRKIAATGADPQPVAVIPIRSMEDLPPLEDGVEQHIAYTTFNPGSSFPPLPGSEADIGTVLRTLVQGDPATFLSPELTLAELRELKVRSICLVTDYSGSGTQVLRFVKAFLRNSTIASWISYGFVRIHVVAHAASFEASTLFREQKHVRFWVANVAKSSQSTDWSEGERRAVIEFCEANTEDSEKEYSLGYGGSFGLYLTNYRVPNNLPHVLIRNEGNPPGLFPGREVPRGFYAELPTYVPPRSLDRILRHVGAEDLADLLLDQTRPIRALRTLVTLHLLDYGIPPAQIDAMLGLNDDQSRELRSTLIALDCLTLDGFLTKRGRIELRRAKHRGWLRHKSKSTPSGTVRYVPSQLR